MQRSVKCEKCEQNWPQTSFRYGEGKVEQAMCSVCKGVVTAVIEDLIFDLSLTQPSRSTWVFPLFLPLLRGLFSALYLDFVFGSTSASMYSTVHMLLLSLALLRDSRVSWQSRDRRCFYVVCI